MDAGLREVTEIVLILESCIPIPCQTYMDIVIRSVTADDKRKQTADVVAHLTTKLCFYRDENSVSMETKTLFLRRQKFCFYGDSTDTLINMGRETTGRIKRHSQIVAALPCRIKTVVATGHQL